MARLELGVMFDPAKFEGCDIEKIGKEALEKAAPIQVGHTQRALSTVTSGGTGKMMASVKPNKAKKAANGALIIHVRPTGTDNERTDGKGKRKTPVRNMAKAAYLEYGVAGHSPSRPWAARAMQGAEARVNEIVKEVMNEKVTKALT